ncbi:hypothetical protein HBI07_139480 [Parastagonospora nodorum]|nr:hypothetical protein HBI07_139480 [Parastagonospora nodorum]
MCAKDDLVGRKGLLQLAGELATAESVTAKDSNHNILSLIAFIISYRLFADELLVYVIIRNLSRECYLTICAILADYKEQVLLTGVKKNRYCTRCTKHYNFNIYVSLATDTLHLLLKGLVIKMLDFMQDMLDDIYPSSRKTWDNSTTLVTQESSSTQLNERFYIRMYRALDSICTRANSEAYHITIVKQFYSITNKKEYILQIYCTYFTRVTRPLPFCRLRWLIPGIQPYSTKLPLSEVAANIAISNFTYAAADRLDVDLSWVSRMSVQIHPSIKCWQSSSKRHNDPKHCDEKVVRCAPNWQQTGLWRRDYLYLILTIIDYTCYDKDGKHMAYIGAFSKVLLFNNNRQIDNTTGMLSILQAFKFYDLSTIIRLVHLVLRDLPNLTTHEYNCLYSLTFDINLLRTLREYRRKRIRNN